MTMAKWVSIVVCFLTCVCSIDAECYTIWGIEGQCVSLRKCEPLFVLLRQRPAPPETYNILKSAGCGFDGLEPKVCCSMDGDLVDSTTFRAEPTPLIFDKKLIAKTMVTTTTATTTTTTTTTTKMTTTPPPLVPLGDHPNRKFLEEDICGPAEEARIFGGNITSIYEFPWMALLGYDVGTIDPEFRCGASLISKRYVLTAAHCVTSLPEQMKLVTVRIGDHDLDHERDCDEYNNGVGFNCAPHYQEFGIGDVRVHPDFTKRRFQNDIAVIRLDGVADIVPPNVRPICLPLTGATVLEGQKVVVTGWGSTELGLRSSKLLKVTLPVVTIAKCNAAYRKHAKVWYKQICAGGQNSLDSCAGDSGGPLQAIGIYKDQPRTIQYGIVSFGPHSCGMTGFPGVYTSVPHYVRWILDQMTE